MPYSTNEEEAALDRTNLFEEDFGDDSLVGEDDINGETDKERKQVTKLEDLLHNSYKNEAWFYEKLTTSTVSKTSTLATSLTENTSTVATSSLPQNSNEKETNDILKIGTSQRKIKQKKSPKKLNPAKKSKLSPLKKWQRLVPKNVSTTDHQTTITHFLKTKQKPSYNKVLRKLKYQKA